MFTLDDTGIATQTLQEILDETSQEMRTQMQEPTLDTSSADSAIGNIIAVVAKREYEMGLLARDVYASTTPQGATGQQATNLALLTGTLRPAATYSTVTLNLNLQPGATIPALSVFRVPNDQYAWYTQSTVTNSGGSPAISSVAAKASAPGPVRANAGTITEAVSSLTGLISCTNPLDAEQGRNSFNDTELEYKREQELQASGTTTVGAIDAALRAIAGVQDCVVVDPEDGTINPVVWDGPGHDADDVLIAQAIQDKKAGGIVSTGGQSASAVDFYGSPISVAFDRATEVQIYMTIQVKIDSSKFPVDGDQQCIDAAVAAADQRWTMGADVITQQLVPAVFGVAGVIDVPEILVSTSPGPISNANLAIGDTSVATADSSRCGVVHV